MEKDSHLAKRAALISVSNLERVYRRGSEEIRALNSVTLEITSGQFVCVTGPSGSGKSTLLYILGLLDRQTKGEYRFNGVVTDQLTDNQRSRERNQFFGFVFQSFHLMPRSTALRNVAMPLEYAANYGKRISKRDMQGLAYAALQRVGLDNRVNHRPNELSGGQRQRVAVARALVNNPQVILADEPTGNLDSKSGQQILELFSSLSAEGRTIVMVTHNVEYVAFCDRHIQMRDGRVEDDRLLGMN